MIRLYRSVFFKKSGGGNENNLSYKLYQFGLNFKVLMDSCFHLHDDRTSLEHSSPGKDGTNRPKLSNWIGVKSLAKTFCILVSLLTVFSVYGESQGDKKSGYKYVIRNYFSSRKPNVQSHQGSPRHLALYLGTSLYSETTDQDVLNPFSSVFFGLSQRIEEFSAIGDLNIRVELLSMQFADKKREWLVDVTPVFSLPDVRSGFPVYVGAGGGVGLFPRHIVRKKPALSLNVRFFAGMRVIDWYENVGFLGEVSVKMHFPFYDTKLYMEVLVTLGSLFSF